MQLPRQASVPKCNPPRRAGFGNEGNIGMNHGSAYAEASICARLRRDPPTLFQLSFGVASRPARQVTRISLIRGKKQTKTTAVCKPPLLDGYSEAFSVAKCSQ